jgi:glycosyltransferase involved in cell wall biosynthesis
MLGRSSRVAIVSDGLPPVGNGGIGTSHGNLMFALKRAGFECRGFTFQESGFRSDETVLRFGFSNWICRLTNALIKIIIVIFRRLGPLHTDIGTVSEASHAILGAFAGFLLQSNIQSFSPDLIVVPDKGAVSAFWSRKLKSKTLFVAHSNPLRFLDNPLIGYRSAADAKLAFKLEQMAVNNCLAVICPSHYMQGVFQSSYRFSGKSVVIPNIYAAIDPLRARHFNTSDILNRYKLSSDVPIIYIPAADNHNKGRQFIFEIVRRVAVEYKGKIAFFLSGHLGPELRKCLEYAPSNVSIIAPGSVKYEDNLELVRCAGICVSPTLIENFGMALLEAQAFGLPVVTFDIGGNRDIVVDRVTGFLRPFLDVDGIIADTLILLRDKELWRAMSTASKTRTETEFSGEAVVKMLNSFLTDIQSKKAGIKAQPEN